MRSIFIITFQLIVLFSFSQKIGMDKMVEYPNSDADKIEAELLKSGWQRNSLQVVSDSNFIRRVWEVNDPQTKVKSYFLYYEFTKDTAENYVVYQFPSRDDYHHLKKEIKNYGFKPVKKKKADKKAALNEENIRKEREEGFLNEKKGTYIVMKEPFYYGLFSFMIYSYRPGSAIAEHAMGTRVK